MIIWLTGQPGSGKTTLAKNLKSKLEVSKKSIKIIDGDILRQLTVNSDYSETGRVRNILNAQLLAKYLHNEGCLVIVSLVSPYLKYRETFKKEIGKEFKEIYVHTSRKTDKDIYKVENYETPKKNYIDINTTNDSIDQSTLKIIKSIS